MGKLSNEFYGQNALEAASGLLGKILVHETAEGITSGVIVETEAYMGAIDPGAHTFNNRRTQRTEVLFGGGGLAYVYLIYGMYCCMNVSVNGEDFPEAVLIRALEPLAGIELMAQRRKTDKLQNLCSGPGKLCTALGITRECNGLDLRGDVLYVADAPAPGEIVTAKRVNIDYAGEAKDYLWRFMISGNRFVSLPPKDRR